MIVVITKLTLSSHNLIISTAKFYILHNNQKICWYCLRNNIENEIHVLFDCDNYYTLWHDTLKRIRTIDNSELYTGNKLQKLKVLLLDRSLKSINIFGIQIQNLVYLCWFFCLSVIELRKGYLYQEYITYLLVYF